MGGFFGITAQHDCIADLLFGTDYHSHLGTRRGGLVVRDGDGFTRSIHDISNTQFRSKFEPELSRFSGTMGLGVISDHEPQPLIIASHLGMYAIVTVSKINNLERLASEAFKLRPTHFTEVSSIGFNPTEMVAALINQERTFEEGIQRAMEAIDGSCSLLLMTEDAIYAGRDRLGRTPITIGTKDGAFAAALESCALPNVGFAVDRQLGPGEVVRITAEGVEQVVPAGDHMQICTFLWIYYGYPASSYEGINAEAARNRCGMALARRDDVDADFVAGIPDSGIGHAIGYAAGAGMPYRRPFVKYTPTWPRSFMPQDQRVRDLVAKMKLIPVPELIDGNRIMFCEDSIVRGTQLRDIIRRLYHYGAKELHMRAACPPLVHSCKFLNFSQSKSEMDLAARKAILDIDGAFDSHLEEFTDHTTDRHAAMVDHIGEQLGLTTLRYQRLDDMVEAVGMPRDHVCTYCWTGEERHR